MTEDTTMNLSTRFDEAFDRIKKATGMRTQVEIAKAPGHPPIQYFRCQTAAVRSG